MADIIYTYAGSAYMNITNKCPCSCVFCIRANGEGLGSAESLWLKKDPTIEEIKAEKGEQWTIKQIEAQKQRRELAQKKKSKLLGFNAMGELSDADFLAMNKACSEEIADSFDKGHFADTMEEIYEAIVG